MIRTTVGGKTTEKLWVFRELKRAFEARNLVRYERTARLLADLMGYQSAESERNRFRYRTTNAEGLATVIDLLCVPDARRDRMRTGVVHHGG